MALNVSSQGTNSPVQLRRTKYDRHGCMRVAAAARPAVSMPARLRVCRAARLPPAAGPSGLDVPTTADDANFPAAVTTSACWCGGGIGPPVQHDVRDTARPSRAIHFASAGSVET